MNGLNPMVMSRLADTKREVEAAMKREGYDELFQDNIKRAMTFLKEVEAMCAPKPTGPVYRINRSVDYATGQMVDVPEEPSEKEKIINEMRL